MKIAHYSEIDEIKIHDSNTAGVTRRVLISAEDNAPNFTMRLFHIEPDGYTYHHTHDFEHEIFVVEGEGEAITSEGPKPVKTGSAIFIEPNEVHQIKNTGETRMSILCIVPNWGHK